MPHRRKSASTGRNHPGHFLREWRDFRNLSQEQVAGRVGLSVPQISKLENGKQGYRQDTLENFAHAYDCEAADLLRPPPTDDESEFEVFVRRLDQKRKGQALRILRAAIGDVDAA